MNTTVRILLVWICLVLGLGGCTDPQSILTSSLPPAQELSQELSDEHPLGLDNIVNLQASQFLGFGEQPWKLICQGVRWQKGRKKAFLKGVLWTLQDSQDPTKIRAQITCSNGVYLLDQGQIDFEEPVTIVRDQETLIANRLHWDSNTQLFRGTQGVRWEKPHQTLQADSFTAPTDLSEIHLEGKIHLISNTKAWEDL